MRSLILFARAVADETRWRLLQLLFDEPLCVCELADTLGMPQSSVSSHLQVIRKAGLLDSERRGKWVYYRVAAGPRALLARLGDHFQANPMSDRKLKEDAKRGARRLRERETSCCPLPRRLAKAPEGPRKGAAAGGVGGLNIRGCEP